MEIKTNVNNKNERESEIILQLTVWMNNKLELVYRKIENHHRSVLKRIKNMETQLKKIEEKQKKEKNNTYFTKHSQKSIINPVLLIDEIIDGFLIKGDSFTYKHDFYINGGKWDKEKSGWIFKEKQNLQKTMEKICEKYTPSPKILWN